jgi:hypothetical protein
MLGKFGESKNLDTAYYLSWACVLGPASVTDYSLPLAKAYQYRASQDESSPFGIVNCGAVLYRAGMYDGALTSLTMAEARSGEKVSAAWARLFLAMTHHRLGQPQKAQQALKQAILDIEKPKPKGGLDAGDSMDLAVLRKEVEEMMEKVPGISGKK